MTHKICLLRSRALWIHTDMCQFCDWHCQLTNTLIDSIKHHNKSNHRFKSRPTNHIEVLELIYQENSWIQIKLHCTKKKSHSDLYKSWSHDVSNHMIKPWSHDEMSNHMTKYLDHMTYGQHHMTSIAENLILSAKANLKSLLVRELKINRC